MVNGCSGWYVPAGGRREDILNGGMGGLVR
jgi:hypothetical protein